MRKLEHLVQRDIGNPDVVLSIDSDAVGQSQSILSTLIEQPARTPIKKKYRGNRDRCLVKRPFVGPLASAALQDKDLVMRIYGNGRNLIEDSAFREYGPAVDDVVMY